MARALRVQSGCRRWDSVGDDEPELGPLFLSRINTFPFVPLRASEDDTRNLLRALWQETVVRAKVRAELLAALSARIPAASRAHRQRVLLPLRRAVYNDRRFEPSERTAEIADEVPQIGSWFESWERTARLETTLDDVYGDAVERERRILRAWKTDDLVQRALAVSGTPTRGKGDDRAPGRAARYRAWEVRQFDRSTLRVSPFSFFTGVHVGTVPSLDREAVRSGEYQFGVRSVPALRDVIISHAHRRMAERSPLTRWRTASLFVVESGRTAYFPREWLPPGERMRMDLPRTRSPREITSPGMLAVAQTLCTLCERQGSLPTRGDMASALTEQLGWHGAAAEAVVDAAIASGLVFPLVVGASAASEVDVCDLSTARENRDGSIDDLRRASAVSKSLVARFSDAGGPERVEVLAETTRAWSHLLGVEVHSPIVEDVFLAQGARIDRSRLDAWGKSLHELRPLLLVADDSVPLKLALERQFVAHYGEGGACNDIHELASSTLTVFDVARAVSSGREPTTAGPLADLVRVRRDVASRIRVLRQNSRQGEPVQVPVDLIRCVGESLPEPVQELRRSHAIFGMPDGDRLVVNRLAGGDGRYFSRFLSESNSESVVALRSALDARSSRSGEEFVQLRPLQGFNPNRSPLLATREFELPEGHGGGDRQVLLKDLTVLHVPGSGLTLVERETGRPIRVLYTGFLAPHFLPPVERLLAMLADQPLPDLRLLTQVGSVRKDVVERLAEVRQGDVTLLRETWRIDGRDFLPRRGETPSEHFRRVNEKRLLAGLPDRVFVRSATHELAGSMQPAKPQHVDFLSRENIRAIFHTTRHLGDLWTVEVVDPLPGPTVRSERGCHALEVCFEVTL